MKKNIPLYTIEDKNKKRKFHMFLTKHVIDSKVFKIDKKVFEILDNSDGIMFEASPFTDTAKINQKTLECLRKKINFEKKLLQDIILNFDKLECKDKNKIFYENLLSYYKRIDAQLEKMLKIRKDMGGSQEYLLISVSHLAFSLLYPNSCLFMENELLKFAIQKNKRIDHLDDSLKISRESEEKIIQKNISKVLQIFESLSEKKSFNFHVSIENELVNEYLNEVFLSQKRLGNLYKKNIIDRNKKWLEKIHNTSNYLVAVGADHFNGKYGLKNLLETKGYSIYKTEEVLAS